MKGQSQLNIEDARRVVWKINEFLYTNYQGIGTTQTLGQNFNYFSDFHRYWERNHKEILNCQIDEVQCERVADALHTTWVRTHGSAFLSLYDTAGLAPEEVCRVRLLTANQDFRGSRDFLNLAQIYQSDHAIFDEELIAKNPVDFVKSIKITNLSQNDKRVLYAKNIALFLIQNRCTPFDLFYVFNKDVYAIRKALIACNGAGYGNKKADMFVRDMVVLGVWGDARNFEYIDVASDVNTIKVALRTGIIRTAIPLVSSFLDIFCYQYGYIDEMNAKAWRTVWEIWRNKYPEESIASPCLIDYFVYQVVGKQFCKENLYTFECESRRHRFFWHSLQNKTCQVCYANGRKGVKACAIGRQMPCSTAEGSIAILHTKYVESLPPDQKLEMCPFANICGSNRYLMPPKSISIMGQTGWSTAYAQKGQGGGGLMA
ncbi:MAG: hypothetical protein IJ144_03510 [Prevotella sp.]|nr:hypothetical protein [Prevotella sp.]